MEKSLNKRKERKEIENMSVLIILPFECQRAEEGGEGRAP